MDGSLADENTSIIGTMNCVNGQLSLINRDLNHVPGNIDLDVMVKVKRLDLSFNLLQNLCGVESFPNLEELIVDNNELTDNVTMPKLPKLHTLSLNKNKLCDLERVLSNLSSQLPSLIYISLLGNLACPNQLSNPEHDDKDYARYRLIVLFHLPKLKFLDSSAVREAERQDAKKYGSFLKPARPNQDKSHVLNNAESLYTPLPATLREDFDNKATFDRCRHVYNGRNSEGNRFIKNSDL